MELQMKPAVLDGHWETSDCMSCGASMTDFVGKGKNQPMICEDCNAPLLAEFWAAYEAAGGDEAWNAYQQEVRAEYERSHR